MEILAAAASSTVTHQSLPASVPPLLYLLSLAFLALFLRWSSHVVLSAVIHSTAAQVIWTPLEPQPIPPPTSGADDATCYYNTLKVITCGRRRRAEVSCRTIDAEECCCPVCLEDIKDTDEVRELWCEHLFHRACLDRWAALGRPTCPLCRAPLQAAVAAELVAAAGTEEFESSELALLGCVSTFQSH